VGWLLTISISNKKTFKKIPLTLKIYLIREWHCMSQQGVPSWITELLEDLTRLETTVSVEGISVEGGHLVAQAQVGQTPDSLNDIVETDGSVAAITAVGSKTALFRNLDGSTGSAIETPDSSTRKFKVFGWELKSEDSFTYTSPVVSSSDLADEDNMVDGDFDTFAEVITDNNDTRNTIVDFGSSAARPLFIKVKATDVIGSPVTNVVTSTSIGSGGPFTEIDTRPLTTGFEELFLLPSGTAFQFVKCEIESIDSLAFTVTQDQFEITTPDSPIVTSSNWTTTEEAKMVDLDLSTFGSVTDNGTIVETTVIVDFGASVTQAPNAKIRANTTVGESTDTFTLGVADTSGGPFTNVASGTLTNNVALTISTDDTAFQFMELIISSTDTTAFTVSHDVFQMWSTVDTETLPIALAGQISGSNMVDGNPATFDFNNTGTSRNGTTTQTGTVEFDDLVERIPIFKIGFSKTSGTLGVTATYEIQVSTDGNSFSTIDSGSLGGSTEGTLAARTFQFMRAELKTVGDNVADQTPAFGDYKIFQLQADDKIFTAATSVFSSPYTAPEAAKIIDSDLDTFATLSDSGTGVTNTAVFDFSTIDTRSIFAIIRMTHTVGTATNTFLLEKSPDNVSYTDVTSGALVTGETSTITVTPTSFRFLRLSILCAPNDVLFTVEDDIFEVFAYTNNTIFSSEFTDSGNIVDGDLDTFATASVTNPTATQEVIIDFGTSEERVLQAKLNITLLLGSASSTAELLTADSVDGPFISRVSLAISDNVDTILDAGTQTFQFAQLLLTSSDADTFQAQNRVFQIYDNNIIEPFNESTVSIGTSDTQDSTLTSTLWEETISGNQTILMPHQVVTLLQNKFLTMEVTQLKTGASITLDQIHTWDQNIALT